MLAVFETKKTSREIKKDLMKIFNMWLVTECYKLNYWKKYIFEQKKLKNENIQVLIFKTQNIEKLKTNLAGFNFLWKMEDEIPNANVSS